MDYLVNNEPDDFLGTLRFEDVTAVYNAREISHMLDVRNLVKSALKAWYILLIILGVIGLAAWKTGNLHELRKAVARGGWLTLGVIGLVITSTFIDRRYTDPALSVEVMVRCLHLHGDLHNGRCVLVHLCDR